MERESQRRFKYGTEWKTSYRKTNIKMRTTAEERYHTERRRNIGGN
jgi:hypothetical protein